MKITFRNLARVAAAAAIALTAPVGCGLFTGPAQLPGIIVELGDPAAVDNDRHFTETLMFSSYGGYREIEGVDVQTRYRYTYDPDGSYEYLREGYEPAGVDLNGNGVAGEGYLITDGSRGTYSYDTNSLAMSISYTSSISGTSWQDDGTGTYRHVWESSPSWIARSADSPYSFTDTLCITERIRAAAFVRNSSGAFVDSYRSVNTYNGGADTNIYESTSTLRFGTGTVTYVSESRDSLNGGPVVVRGGEKWTLEVHQTMPSEASFAAGQIMKFTGFYTEHLRRWYDYNTSVLPDWSESYDHRELGERRYAHAGEFIIDAWYLTDFDRSIEASAVQDEEPTVAFRMAP